ncbi:MAG: nicotinate-nucleotide--dimethylbenzimidazole phosphoribosyltransferase [Candidatus Promineifilaceae bacterium]
MFNLQIPSIDESATQAAAAQQADLTKPAGALGKLEPLSIRLAGMTGNPSPTFDNKGVIVMAGDHGVTAEGVSAFPSAVTPQMVLNFLMGGAAVNVLARQAGATVTVVDMGVNFDFDDHPQLVKAKVARGTDNMAVGPAMSREQAVQAIQAGIDVVSAEIAKGLNIVAIGEMGIGNTTPASAITAVFTGLPVADITGRGTGLDDAGLANKVAVIERAIATNAPDASDPIGVLAKLGGYEIAGLAGVVLGAAAHRVPVITDGFIASSAALIAAEIDPAAKDYLLASHNSVEIGHQAILARLGLEPLFDLGFRLGEGTGAVMAFHFVEAAVRTLNEMATFASAGVSEKDA